MIIDAGEIGGSFTPDDEGKGIPFGLDQIKLAKQLRALADSFESGDAYIVISSSEAAIPASSFAVETTASTKDFVTSRIRMDLTIGERRTKTEG